MAQDVKIKLRKMNLGKRKIFVMAILTLGTLLATGFFFVSVLNTAQAQPANANQISEEIQSIGQVDVHNLPKASGSAVEKNNVPVHHIDEQKFARGKALADTHRFVSQGQSAKVIVSPSTASTAPLAVSSSLTLNGVSGDLPNPCGCSPPDSNLGVGPNHVFEIVNLAGIIYYKNGNVAKNTFALSNFFGLPTNSMSDPEILYDTGSGRWFASIIDMSRNSVRFAVSTSNDPTGTWKLYAASYSPYFPDQPFIGASDDKFVISANDFVPSGSWPYAGVQYWIINKTDLVKAARKIHAKTYSPDPTMFSLHPARHLTTTPVFYMITDCLSACVSDAASTTSSARLVAISGVPGVSTITITSNDFNINTMSNPPSAIQPNTTQTLDTNDDRVLSAVWENNNLWFAANDNCSGNSCARLINITTQGTSPPTKVQDFDYGAPGQYYFYPAVSLSHGTLVVVYGQSSLTMYPSLLVTGQTLNDPLNTLQAPITIVSGTASDTSTVVTPARYGDYFGAATDPNPSPGSPPFWVAGEYRKSSGFQSWSTEIAQVAVS